MISNSINITAVLIFIHFVVWLQSALYCKEIMRHVTQCKCNTEV